MPTDIMVQGSDEWHEARLGKVTASNLVNVLMKPDAAGYQKYLYTLACERMTGTRTEGYKSFEMERGNELEGEARAAYEFDQGVTVDQVGFVEHPTMPNTGSSPDGLVGLDGGFEVKCVEPHIHAATINGKIIDKKYRDQITWNMECCQRQWWDFTSYCPVFPMRMRLHITRIWRNEEAAQAARVAVMQFEAKVKEAIANLQARFPE